MFLKLQAAGQGLVGLPMQFCQVAQRTFQQYFGAFLDIDFEANDEGEIVVPLAFRAAALHPRYGHLSFLTVAQRDAVWTAVLKDGTLLARDAVDPVLLQEVYYQRVLMLLYYSSPMALQMPS